MSLAGYMRLLRRKSGMKHPLSIRTFLNAALVEGVVALIWLLLIPGEGGLSASRLMLLAALLLPMGAVAFLSWKANSNPQWSQKTTEKVEAILIQDGTRLGWITIILAIIIVGGIYFLSFTLLSTDQFIRGYLIRLTPLVFWGLAVCGQLFALIAIWQFEVWRNFLLHNRTAFFYSLLALFIATVTFKVSDFNIERWNKLADAAYGVILHTPHWRAYANRLLGPYTILALSQLGVSFETAMHIFNFLMISVQIMIIYSVVLRFSNLAYKTAIRYVIFFSFILLCMQDYYSYPWDYIDTAIFILFVWGIFRGKATIYFVVLFLVELLNREIAILISFYLILDSFSISLNKTSPKITLNSSQKNKLTLGMILSIGGILYTKLLRDTLFIKSSLLGVGDDITHKLFGNHFQFTLNIKELFVNNFSSLNFITSLYIFGLIIFYLISISKSNPQHIKALIMLVITCLAILAFGLINETRMLMITIPFLIFLIFDLDIQASRPAQN